MIFSPAFRLPWDVSHNQSFGPQPGNVPRWSCVSPAGEGPDTGTEGLRIWIGIACGDASVIVVSFRRLRSMYGCEHGKFRMQE
jgi:hypothetical protein